MDAVRRPPEQQVTVSRLRRQSFAQIQSCCGKHFVTFRCDIPVVFYKPNTRYITSSRNTTKIYCTVLYNTLHNYLTHNSFLLYPHRVEQIYRRIQINTSPAADTTRIDMIYLSTAIGLTPGGSGTVHTINT